MKTERYISPQGNICRIIRENDDTVTLMIEHSDGYQHEWTTTRRNFESRYVKDESIHLPKEAQ